MLDRTAVPTVERLCRFPARRIPMRNVDGAEFVELERGGTATFARPPRAYAGEEPFSKLTQRVLDEGYPLAPPGILTLRGGRFQLPRGIVSSGGRFPEEAIPLPGFPYSWQLAPALAALWRPASTVPDGMLISLQLAHAYYHWVAELLPLVLLATERCREGPLYVAADMPGFVGDYLELFGLADRVVPLGRGVYRCARLSLPTFSGAAERPSPAHLRDVRQRVLELAAPSGGSRRRLLVSRADAPDRRIANEAALLAAMAPFGVERVCFEGMGVADQVRLVRNAELIVAPHGGGLTNMLFAPTDCRIVELSGQSHVAACYAIIAAVLGQPHHHVPCAEDRRDLVADIPRVIRAAIA